MVYDLHENSVCHYLNGQLISRQTLKQPRLIQIRSAMLGSWDPADDKDLHMIRNFRGRIDEFNIRSR